MYLLTEVFYLFRLSTPSRALCLLVGIPLILRLSFLSLFLLLLLQSPKNRHLLLPRFNLPLTKPPQLLSHLLIPHIHPREIHLPTFLHHPPTLAPAIPRLHRRVQDTLCALLRGLEDQPPQRPGDEVEEEAPEGAAGEPAAGAGGAAETRVDGEDAGAGGLAIGTFVGVEVGLEGLGEDHEGEFAEGEETVVFRDCCCYRLFGFRGYRDITGRFKVEFGPDITRTRRKDNPHIPM